MKRFILDGFLILIIVSLGSALSRQQEPSVQQRVDDFNDQVLHHQIVGQQSQGLAVSQIEENWAGQVGENISSMVIRVVSGWVRLISAAFDR